MASKRKTALKRKSKSDRKISKQTTPAADAPKSANKPKEIPPADFEEAEEGEGGTFPIVGIGASAGGLEAFTEMLQVLPADTGMGFVLVQHLDPKHVSILTELLQRHTKMPVRDAAEGMKVEPNHVYVMPRNKHMGMSRGVLTLSPRVGSPVPHMPIDPFLRSLAADQKSKAIGLILSGNASDGTLGMLAIKAAGGITFAQSSESAKYDSMPRSAVAAGCIDFVLPPKEIAKELARLGRHPYISPATEPGEPSAAATLEGISRILGLLRSGTGVDFTYYKASTIRRRILRRMALRQESDVNRYIARLRKDRTELRALYEDILINVTEFFRDPEVFEQLKKVVFPKIIPTQDGGHRIRIWVPGCSSGEEVYSIAIALLEYLGERHQDAAIQIFGTDISDAALDRARIGTYAPSVVQDLSAERLRRFFTKVDSSYQIIKRIREMCVFAKQNLIKDPPFSRLDLISCRNVLIYLGPVLQKRVIPIFHYALMPNGYLLLGSSETIGGYGELFSQEDKKAKIYKRRPGTARAELRLPIEDASTREAPLRPQSAEWNESELLHEADRIILAKFAPAGVVVDGELNILQFRGRMSPYLEHSPGTASLNLLRMAREGLSADLRNAVNRAQLENMPVAKKGIRVPGKSGGAKLNLEVIPFKKMPDGTPRYLILFEEAGNEAPPEIKVKQKRKPSTVDRENAHLRQELAAAKEYLQSVLEEHESSNEELRSANEEIQSSNEELQSTNEELETAKEELQSTNEELNTVNEELQTRNLQLAQVGNDLLNLLTNVNIPIIMLGNDLRIRRFTPISERLLNLIPADVGRPLSDINLNLNVTKVDHLVSEVIDDLTPRTIEVKDLSGRPYSLRIRPYRTEDNKIDGAVIVLVDLDPARATAESVAELTMDQGNIADGQRSTDEARAFSAGLLLAQEVERRNLARELHDDLSQRMALLQLNVQTLERAAPAPADLKKQLHSLDDQISGLSSSLRRIAYQLHPAALEDLGLAGALESYVHEFGNRENIQVAFQAGNMPGSIDPDTGLCLYRIVQESLRNIAQHAQSRSARVTVAGSEDTIELKVKDTGSGFDVTSVKGKGGLGLRSMEERARALGGSFRLQSSAGAGTEIVVEIPTRRRENSGGKNGGAEKSSIDTVSRV